MSCLLPSATEILTEHTVQNTCLSLLFDLVIQSKLFLHAQFCTFVSIFPFFVFLTRIRVNVFFFVYYLLMAVSL